MQEQMKTIRSESKGKGSAKVSPALDELEFLMDFNASITQAAAKTMEHLSDFVFISMGNLTLARRDAYLNHVKGGVKTDTIAALRTAPLHIPTLFPDSVIKRAEEEIAHFEAKGQSSSRGKGRYHPYECTEKRSNKRSDSKNDRPAWKNISKGSYKKSKGKPEFNKTDIRHLSKFKCKLSCCSSCSFCARTLPTERVKSRVSRLLLQKSQIKVCEKCFL